MKWHNSLIILAVLITYVNLISIAKADIMSINDYGSSQLVITPDNNIEGFFFHDVTAQAPGQGGGGGASSEKILTNYTNATKVTKPSLQDNGNLPLWAICSILAFVIFLVLFRNTWARTLKLLSSTKESKEKS